MPDFSPLQNGNLPQWNPFAEGVFGADIKQNRDANSCTVIALACVTGRSYKQCYEWMKKFGRRHRKGMYGKEIHQALMSMRKFKVIKGEYDEDHRITVNQFIVKHPKGRYYVRCRGHAFAIVDGVVYDHSNMGRRQIKCAYRVYSQKELEGFKNARVNTTRA